MKRTQIQITDKQYSYLKKISSEKNISLAEVVREAISSYSSSVAIIDYDSKIKDALSLIGKYKSGKKDISIKHDDYIEKELEEENKSDK
ncbi:MAG: hypothetical protein M1479_06125 [Actinobacteria bacterium]|nr:hypothetical protein [Cyanobacteriota bacterium]MCL5771832.1 hypothetical protein [Actinomycetota bacterium]